MFMIKSEAENVLGSSNLIHPHKDPCFPRFPFVWLHLAGPRGPYWSAKGPSPTSQGLTQASLLLERSSWSLTPKKIYTSCSSGLVFWQSTHSINLFCFIKVYLLILNCLLVSILLSLLSSKSCSQSSRHTYVCIHSSYRMCLIYTEPGSLRCVQ